MKISLTLIIIAIFFGVTDLCAQSNDIRYEVEAQAIGTTNGVVPFWMRSNQYGSVPLAGVSGSLIGRAYKDYEEGGPYTLDSKLVDWAAGFQGRVNLGNGSNLQLIEAYGKLRVGMFQLQAGRTRDVMGLNGDTTLSSGNFAVSGNALGIPKVEISIPEYWTIPWFDGLFAVKGNFAHGWVGKVPVADTIDKGDFPYLSGVNQAFTYLHQKSLYGRLGRPNWKFRLFAGFNHQVYWGDEREIYGEAFDLSDFQTLMYVMSGRAYGSNGIPRSKIGNQIGSIDLAGEINLKNTILYIYRQNFYDVGALYYFANIKDGLNGVSVVNKRYDLKSEIQWKKILFEFFYSKDQAGYPWSRSTPSGDEDYYNNSLYSSGWSYNGKGLGTPLIIESASAREKQTQHPADYFISNRVIAGHVGFEGAVRKWMIQTKVSYAKHYGTFGTSEYGKSTGGQFHQPQKPFFLPVSQLSSMLSIERVLQNNVTIGAIATCDQGRLLNNSCGINLYFRKTIF